MTRTRKKMRREKPEFEQRLLDLRRVTRVVKGGRRFRFRATVVIGDRRGKVGVGTGKGSDVSDSISKAYAAARKEMVAVPMQGGTIPHDIRVKVGSARILLKPAEEGRGLIAGGAVRAIADLAGIYDMTAKSLGTNNKLNVARATLVALSSLQAASKHSDNTEKKNSVVKKETAQKGIPKKKVTSNAVKKKESSQTKKVTRKTTEKTIKKEAGEQ